MITPLEHRILDISLTHGLSHIGSCLTAVGIIDDIYKKKKRNEKFVLSCGHSGLALYVVLEKYKIIDSAEYMIEACGVHPDRGMQGIDSSTGSLGQGLPIALGMAMADRTKNVYCLISDGECAEGSIWEALCVKKRYSVANLQIYVNYNGYGAYGETSYIGFPFMCHWHDTSDHWFMKMYGQEAHYKVLNKQEYEEIILQHNK